MTLLKKHEYMFDDTLGYYIGTENKIELLEGAQPNHTKLFPIPKVYKETLKTEINRLVSIGVLKHENNSEQAVPTFVIAKKNGNVCFISDFRELLLLKLGGFKYDSSLDLNMGYYHIKL